MSTESAELPSQPLARISRRTLMSLIALAPFAGTLAHSTPAFASTLNLSSPLAGGYMSLEFGSSKSPYSAENRHRGEDWLGSTRVISACPGVVIGVETGFTQGRYENNGWGNRVRVRSTSRAFVTYNHLRDAGLEQNQFVDRGAPIGTAGLTGYATGVHLHFELWIDGLRVDPRPYYSSGLPGDPIAGALPPSEYPSSEDDMRPVLYKATGHPPVIALGSKFWALSETEAASAVSGGVPVVWLVARTLTALINDARASKSPNLGPLLIRRPSNVAFVAHGGVAVLDHQNELDNIKNVLGAAEISVSNALSEVMIKDIRNGTNA